MDRYDLAVKISETLREYVDSYAEKHNTMGMVKKCEEAILELMAIEREIGGLRKNKISDKKTISSAVDEFKSKYQKELLFMQEIKKFHLAHMDLFKHLDNFNGAVKLAKDIERRTKKLVAKSI